MSSNTGGGGPIPGGPDQFTQQSMRAQQASRESAKTMDDLITQILEFPSKAFSKLAGVNISNWGTIPGLPDFSKSGLAFVNDAMNKGAQSFTANGGIIARELGVAFQRPDFSNITAATIEGMPIEAQQAIASMRDMVGDGMPVVAMSNENLGNLTPSAGGAAIRGEGMGMMA